MTTHPLDETDDAFTMMPEIRAFVRRFREDGVAWQGAMAELTRFVHQTARLATLYEERTSHLEDVIQERNRYHEEAKTLRDAIAHRMKE